VFVAPAATLAQLPARGGAVVGRVTDPRSAEGIADASVEVEGTRLGAVTDADGRYRITGVPAGSHSIVARRLGFTALRRSVTVTEAQDVTADFALQPSAVSLDQVVITGSSGGDQKRSVGNAVATIDAPDALSKSASPNLGSLLSARVSGLVVSQPTGRLGAGPAIQIRGRSSIGLGNSPILYIDGIRINNAVATGPTAVSGGLAGQNSAVAGRLNDINPEDIESIQVIKGPAASTIYGTEASSGVIQIITKRGATGSKPQFSMQAEGGPIYFRDAEGRMPTNFAKDSTGTIVTWNAVQQEKARGTPLFETGQASHLSGSLAGGQNTARYYVSTTYQQDKGIEPNNNHHQVSLHANLDVAPTDKIDLSTTMNFVDLRDQLGVDAGASAMFGAVFGHSVVFPLARGFGLNFTPDITQHLWDNSSKVNRFTTGGNLTHRPFTWLSHSVDIGVDYTGDDSRSLERFAPPNLAAILPAATAAGRIRQTLRRGVGISASYSATSRFSLTSNLSSASSVGGTIARTENNTSTLGGTGFPGAGIETVSGVALPETPTQTLIVNSTIGAYAQQKFAWRDRLFITGALRVDNNSAFGDNFKWITYPKVDASWVVSDESFWPLRRVMPSLRLRAAYGQSGRPPTTFLALRTFLPVPGPNGTNAVTPGALGNPDLKPERGKELEAGFEAAFFTRLNLDFTYFSKQTEDEIINQAVAPSAGFSGTRPLNLGRVDNHGIELAATMQMLTRQNFDWELRGTIATNKDEVKDLGGVPSVIVTFGQFNKVGYPIGAIFSKVVVSADRAANGTATNVLCSGGPGQPAVACATAPFLFLGTPTPKSSGAVANTFTIAKRLRLYALVDFKRGNKQLDATGLLRCTGALGAGLCEANYRPEKYDPVFLAETVGNATAQSIIDQWYESASFAKLREVSATYTLPNKWIPGTSQASLTIAGRELHTWTKYRGIDPEVSSAGTGGATAQDQALYPPLSRIVATLNIRF
jgi:TonB-linked SusC/RagA family outer membrane protein